jgi:hypothetical protein
VTVESLLWPISCLATSRILPAAKKLQIRQEES